MFSHGLQYSRHFFTLPFGSNVGSDTFFKEFQASLVLWNPQKFHSSLFIGRKTSDFSDQITNKSVVIGLFSLVVGRLDPSFIGSGLVTLVQTGAQFVLRSHPKIKFRNLVLEICGIVLIVKIYKFELKRYVIGAAASILRKNPMK